MTTNCETVREATTNVIRNASLAAGFSTHVHEQLAGVVVDERGLEILIGWLVDSLHPQHVAVGELRQPTTEEKAEGPD